jgi:hypothetical protein
LANCILWGDTPQEIYLSGSNSPTVFNCDVQGGWSGSGNISVNPAFVDAPHGNYRLSLHSPCIDVGSNAAIPAGVIVDMDGNPRLVDGNCDGAAIADMGAYEFAPPSGDFNCDGSVNVADYWYIHDGIGHCSPEQAYQDHVLADLDHDGCITLADYQSWLTCYRNANGVGFTLPPQDSDASVFINVLLGFDADPAHLVTFDLNGDQTVDGRDIQQFVNALCGP